MSSKFGGGPRTLRDKAKDLGGSTGHLNGLFSESPKATIDRLVYYEVTNDVEAAIRREKQVKSWVRRKKVALIEAVSPEWNDLSGDLS